MRRMSEITTLAEQPEFQAGPVDESAVEGFLDSFFLRAGVVVAQPFSRVETSPARMCRLCLRSVSVKAMRGEPECR